MPVFIGKHKIPEGVSESDAKETWAKYKAAAQAKGLKTVHVNYSLEKGFSYCETIASNAQEVQDAHNDAQIPVDEIIQVSTVE